MSTVKKTVKNCLWVGGFEGQLFKKSIYFANCKFIILKDKTLFEMIFFVFCVFWAILEALQMR